jgi:phosphomannomutase
MTTTMTTPEKPRIIALFDVDGTLTIPRGEITSDMLTFMKTLSTKVTVGIVGGSDLPKQEEQLGEGIVNIFPYNFSQNGLVAYKNGELQEVQTIAKFLGEDNVKRIVNWTMRYLADIDIPLKVRLGYLYHITFYSFGPHTFFSGPLYFFVLSSSPPPFPTTHSLLVYIHITHAHITQEGNIHRIP